MSSRKKLQNEYILINSMRGMVEAYEEIAAMRMRKVKKSVLQNRDFLSGLNDIYQRLSYTYKLYLEKVRHAHRAKTWSPLDTNGKTISVLLSANTGLYGDIIRRTYSLFLENIKNTETDVVIVGRVGKQFYETNEAHKPFKYFELSDSGADADHLKAIISAVLPYTNVIVYHGIYVSVLNQNPTRTFVTGKALDYQDTSRVSELKCIVEPSIEEVTAFFEKQILSAIFEQTTYEASLSKFASRMVSLDMAHENINVMTKRINFAKLKLRHLQNNLTQMDRLSGISLWTK
jgi:F0F1-type ATP synthase gamma subunit